MSRLKVKVFPSVRDVFVELGNSYLEFLPIL